TRGNNHAALWIELAVRSEVIDAIQKAQLRRMRGRHRSEFFLELEPDGHRINPHVFAREAGQKDLAAVLLLDKTAKGVWNLEPPLVINAGGCTTPEHEPLLHFDPQKTTSIVGLCLR